MHVDAFPSRPTAGDGFCASLRISIRAHPAFGRRRRSFPSWWGSSSRDDAGLPQFARESGSAGEKIRSGFCAGVLAVGVKGMDRMPTTASC